MQGSLLATEGQGTEMGLISLIIVLAVLGVALYLLEQLPMVAPFKILIRVIVILVVVLYLMQAFVGDIQLPRLR